MHCSTSTLPRLALRVWKSDVSRLSWGCSASHFLGSLTSHGLSLRTHPDLVTSSRCTSSRSVDLKDPSRWHHLLPLQLGFGARSPDHASTPSGRQPFPTSAVLSHLSSPSDTYWTVQSTRKPLWDPCTPSELGGPFSSLLLTTRAEVMAT